MNDAGIMPRETIRELLGDMPALSDGEDDIEDAEVVDSSESPTEIEPI